MFEMIIERLKEQKGLASHSQISDLGILRSKTRFQGLGIKRVATISHPGVC